MDPALAGRITAVGVELQRETRAWYAKHGDLLDPEMASLIALAYAFASPWRRAGELRLCVLMNIWVSEVDDVIDRQAHSEGEIDDVVTRCLACAAGAVAPTDRLTTTLAGICDELRARPLWPRLGALWHECLLRMLDTMRFEWRSAADLAGGLPAPTFDTYIANSDGCGFLFLRLTDWLSTEGADLLPQLEQLMAAAAEGQVAARLRNDLGTWRREQDLVDLNALKLGVSEEEVAAVIAERTARCHELLRPLLAADVAPARYLKRILAFGNAFYETTDFRPLPTPATTP